MENEIFTEVQSAFAEIIQIAIDCGIPFNHVPTNNAEVVYLQQSIIWVTFILGIGFKGLFKLMGSMVSGCK